MNSQLFFGADYNNMDKERNRYSITEMFILALYTVYIYHHFVYTVYTINSFCEKDHKFAHREKGLGSYMVQCLA